MDVPNTTKGRACDRTSTPAWSFTQGLLRKQGLYLMSTAGPALNEAHAAYSGAWTSAATAERQGLSANLVLAVAQTARSRFVRALEGAISNSPTIYLTMIV